MPAKASEARGPLDTTTVHKLYMEGEFDRAIVILERAFKENRIPTHGDSVFALKHLGVMRAANSVTRETGKRYLYQLLNIEPTVRIADMYASDMIYKIFQNIQEEVETERARLPRVGQSRPDSAVNTSENKSSHRESALPSKSSRAARPRSNKWVWWTAGLTGTALATSLLTWQVLDHNSAFDRFNADL